MPQQAGNRTKIFGEINITPLTDIFLVLLIIMMVVAPMVQQSSQEITTPELVNGMPVEQGRLIVEVTSDGQYFVAGNPTTADALTDVLRSNADQVEEKNVVIRADKAVRSGAVMKVLEAARDAEYEKVTVAGEALSSSRQQELQQSQSSEEAGS